MVSDTLRCLTGDRNGLFYFLLCVPCLESMPACMTFFNDMQQKPHFLSKNISCVVLECLIDVHAERVDKKG